MRLRKIMCLAAIILTINVHAQDLKILVDKKGKVGYADQSGNEVIKCQYESALPFSDGLAIVTKAGKKGLIDTTGKIVLPLKYAQISTWNNELYLVKLGKKVGLVDHSGKVVLPATYSLISKLNCYGKALIAVGGKATANNKKTYMANAKYGIIDAHGNVLVLPKYKGLYEFSYDCASKYPYYEGRRLGYSYHNTVDTLETDCSYLGYSGNGLSIYNAGVIDGNGKELVKSGLYYFVMQPQSDMVRYYNVKKKETSCGYHNIATGKGFEVTKFDTNIDDIKFWSHGDFIGNIAPVNGSSWSFVDKGGKTLRTGFGSLKHDQLLNLWAAKNSSEKWEVFTDGNSDIASLSGYEDIYFPAKEGDKEVFSVKKDGNYGCIDRNGKTIVPFEYEYILSNTYDVIPVKKEGKWGLLSADNTLIIPIEYASVNLPSERNSEHFWVMKSDSLCYHYNLASGSLSNVGYKFAGNFKNKLAYVVPQNMVIEDTPVNRAQMFAPNTPKASIDALQASAMEGSFVNIINVDDEMVFDLPVSSLYMETIRKEIEKNGLEKPTEYEKKNMLLKVTKENRSYDLKSVLKEEEWNY